jgi:hypothetical protein
MTITSNRIENETGKKYVIPFVDADYPAGMKGQNITREQAQQLIDQWNRAQANHKREVSYQLEAEPCTTIQ